MANQSGTITSAQGRVTITGSPNDVITFTPTAATYSVEYPIGTANISGATTTQTLTLSVNTQCVIWVASGSVAWSLVDNPDSSGTTVDAAGVLTAMQAMDGTQQTSARSAIGAVDSAGARSAVILPPTTIGGAGPLTRSANGNRTTFVTANGISPLVQVDATGGWQADDMIVVQGFSALAATVTADTGVTFLADAGTTAATASAVGRQVVLQHTQTANEWRVLSAAVVVAGSGGVLIYPATGYTAASSGTLSTIATISIPGNVVGTRGQVRLKVHCRMPGTTDPFQIAAYASAATFDSTTLIAVDTASALMTEHYGNWLVAEGNGTDTLSIIRSANSQGNGPGSAIGVAMSATSGVITNTLDTVAVNTSNAWTITIRANRTSGTTDTLTPLSAFAEVITLGN